MTDRMHEMSNPSTDRPDPPPSPPEINKKRCEACGAANAPWSAICRHCKASLYPATERCVKSIEGSAVNPGRATSDEKIKEVLLMNEEFTELEKSINRLCNKADSLMVAASNRMAGQACRPGFMALAELQAAFKLLVDARSRAHSAAKISADDPVLSGPGKDGG